MSPDRSEAKAKATSPGDPNPTGAPPRTIDRREAIRLGPSGAGILVAAGPSIAAAAERGDAAIADIAPTALHLLDQPVYAEMTGVVLSELLGLEGQVRILSEADDPLAHIAPEHGAAPFTPDDLKELEARMKALGYTD